MTDIAAQTIAIIRKELSSHYLFGELPEIAPDTLLGLRWFGPVDRCCVAIELSDHFGAEVPGTEIDAWVSVADIIASVRKLVTGEVPA